MRKSMWFLFFFFMSSFVSAQEPEFLWLKSIGSLTRIISSTLTLDSHNNIYLTGYYTDTIELEDTTFYMQEPSILDGFLAKFDADGNYQWVNFISGRDKEFIGSVECDSKDNVFIGGNYNTIIQIGDTLIKGHSYYNSIVSKLDNSGNYLWIKNIYSPYHCFVDGLTISSDDNGVFILNSQDTSFVDSLVIPNYGNADFAVVELNSGTGQVEWYVQTKGGGHETANDIITDPAGNLVVTGKFYYSMKIGNYFMDGDSLRNLYILKLDKSGGINWVKKVATGNNISVHKITSNKLSQYFIIGHFEGAAFFDDSKLESNGERDVYIAKFDSSGNLQWVRSFGGPADDAVSGIAAAGKEIIITGYFNDKIQFDSLSISSLGSSDIYWCLLDENGRSKWVKQAGGVSSDKGIRVLFDSENNCITSGNYFNTAYFDQDTLTGGLQKIFMAKLNTSDFISFDGMDISPDYYRLFNNYPNPFNSSTKISIYLAIPAKIKINIYDITGRKITELVNDQFSQGYYSFIWDGKNAFGQKVSSGIYFYSANVNGVSSSKKMVLVR